MRKILLLLMFISMGFSVTLSLIPISVRTVPESISPGDNVTLYVDLYHTGASSLVNITATLETSPPFTGNKIVSHVPKIDPDEYVTLPFSFTVNKNAEPGVYAVTLKLKYKEFDSQGYIYDERPLYIPVSLSEKLQVSSVVVTPEVLVPGENFTLKITIKNNGKLPGSAWVFVNTSNYVTLHPQQFNVDTIKDVKTIVLSGRVLEYASPGAYPGIVVVKSAGSTAYGTFYIQVRKPELLIYTENTMGEIGKWNELKLVLVPKGTLNDVYVSVSSQDVSFKKTEFYFNRLDSTKDIILDYFPSRELLPGVHSLVISYHSFELSGEKTINLLLFGKPVISFAGLSTDEHIYPGMKTTISILLENIGTEDAKSVKVLVHGYGVSYVGSIDRDDTGSAVMDIVFDTPGEKNLTFDVVYTDPYGNEYKSTFSQIVLVQKLPQDYSWVFLVAIFLFLIWFFKFRRRA